METRTCKLCEKTYAKTSENFYRRPDGNYLPVCRACDRVRKRASSERYKAQRKALKQQDRAFVEKAIQTQETSKVDLSTLYPHTTDMSVPRSTQKGTLCREDLYLLTLRVLQKLREEEEMRAAYARRVAWQARARHGASKHAK